MTQPQALARRLGTGDAVVIGLGSMIGAGVFAAFAPAARAAGAALLVGLAARGRGRLLQRDRVGPARRAVPDLGWDLRLRPRAARATGGGSPPAGGSWSARPHLRGDGAHLRGLRRHRRRMGQRLVAVAAVVALTAAQLPRHHHGRRCSRGSSSAVALALRWPSSSSAIAVGGGSGRRSATVLVARPRRRLRRAPVGRTAVLRLRRLRAHRHAGRGGPRSGADDPARDPARAGDRGRGLPVVGIALLVAAGRRPGWRPPPPRWRRGGRGRAAWAAPVVRIGAAVGESGRAARPDRGHRPDRPGHGPRARPARAGWPRCTRDTACRTTPRSRSPRSSACWC